MAQRGLVCPLHTARPPHGSTRRSSRMRTHLLCRILGVAVATSCGSGVADNASSTSGGERSTEEARLRCPAGTHRDGDLCCPEGTHKAGKRCAPASVCGDGSCLDAEDCSTCASD